MIVVKGDAFIHDTRLDTTWRPGPGEKYADGPHEVMQVFRATRDRVWFGPVGATRSDTVMDRAEFEHRFGSRIR